MSQLELFSQEPAETETATGSGLVYRHKATKERHPIVKIIKSTRVHDQLGYGLRADEVMLGDKLYRSTAVLSDFFVDKLDKAIRRAEKNGAYAPVRRLLEPLVPISIEKKPSAFDSHWGQHG